VPQPLGQRLAQRHHDEQAGEHGHDADDIQHASARPKPPAGIVGLPEFVSTAAGVGGAPADRLAQGLNGRGRSFLGESKVCSIGEGGARADRERGLKKAKHSGSIL
jgi:hypothetical protein